MHYGNTIIIYIFLFSFFSQCVFPPIYGFNKWIGRLLYPQQNHSQATVAPANLHVLSHH